MALISSALRTCGLIIFCVSIVLSADSLSSNPWIVSFRVDGKSCVGNECKYLLNLRGGDCLGHLSWRLTPNKGARGDSCDVLYPSYEVREVFSTKWQTTMNVTVPFLEGRIYFCVLHTETPNNNFVGKWIHQGEEYYLDPKNDQVTEFTDM